MTLPWPSLLLLLWPAAVQTPDRVHLMDATTVSGQVTAATLDAVSVTGASGEQKIEARQVFRIEFADKPEALRNAESFLQAHDYQNAVNSFESADGAVGPWWVQPVARLGRADALLAWSRIDKSRAGEAADAYAQWLSAYPNSFFEPRARLGQARALSLAGKTEDASRLLEELATTAFQRNLGKHVELGARLERALAYLAGGQAQVAEARLNDLVPEIGQVLSAGPPKALVAPLRQLLAQAEIALGEAKVARNGDAAARPYWEGLLADRSAGPDTRGAATIGLALAARSEGKHREAQLLLARVVATLPGGSETLARALYELGDVSRELGNSPVASALYFQQVVAEFPSSPWAAKARVELGG
ncbi:MAG: tetratricopeptide repeat protein [Planctomycetota bacterium]|nr:MAG: tetratricopeptide repeat protein [Planctomycetota bacterium]